MPKKTYTAVVNETSSPFPPVYPAPLIYTVELDDPEDKQSALQQIAKARCDDLGADGDDDCSDEEILEQIRDGLELHFLFEGDLTTAADFRS